MLRLCRMRTTWAWCEMYAVCMILTTTTTLTTTSANLCSLVAAAVHLCQFKLPFGLSARCFSAFSQSVTLRQDLVVTMTIIIFGLLFISNFSRNSTTMRLSEFIYKWFLSVLLTDWNATLCVGFVSSCSWVWLRRRRWLLSTNWWCDTDDSWRGQQSTSGQYAQFQSQLNPSPMRTKLLNFAGADDDDGDTNRLCVVVVVLWKKVTLRLWRLQFRRLRRWRRKQNDERRRRRRRQWRRCKKTELDKEDFKELCDCVSVGPICCCSCSYYCCVLTSMLLLLLLCVCMLLAQLLHVSAVFASL